MWGDVQGAERDVIEGGGRNTLKVTKYFYVEYGEISSYPSAMAREETVDLLKRHGFEIVSEYSDEGKIGNLLLANKSI